MKQKTFGTLALLGAAALAGCYSYASEAINNGDYNNVKPAPVFAYVGVGDSTQEIVRLVNAANVGTLTSYTVSNVGAGIAVHYAPNYRPLYSATNDTLNPTGDKNAQEYFIVGLAPGRFSFTLTPTSVNTGVSATVNVLVHLKNLGTALDRTTAVAGDTLTFTAPAGEVFTSNSKVTFPTGGAVVVAGISADSTHLYVLANGGISGAATVTNVGQLIAPTVTPVTLTTTNTLTTPALFAGTLTRLNGSAPLSAGIAGDTLVLTAAPNEVFGKNKGTATTSVQSVISFQAGPNPKILSISADSTQIVFEASADTGQLIVTRVGIKNAPNLAVQTLNSTNAYYAPLVIAAPTTVSAAQVAIGVPVTVTLGGGLRFTDSSQVLIGGNIAGIQSVSADSSTAVVLPQAGEAGNVTYANIALSRAKDVPITLPSDGKSITVGSTFGGPTSNNPLSIATADLVATSPRSGRSLVISDVFTSSTSCSATFGAGATCRYYKVVTTATKNYDAEIRWDPTASTDFGAYFVNSSGGAPKELADENGVQAGGPEKGPSGGTGNVAAGTYYIAIVNFGPATPAYFTFRLAPR